jgi:cation transport regulator ChaB
MPYSSNEDLPKAVRGKLSAHQQSVFRNVFNSMMGEDGMSESRAFAGAWSQAKQAVQKADYQGRSVELDKPFRLPAGSTKKFGVYVKSGDKVKKVTFGDPNMEIRRDDPDARANFRSRHSCDTATDKTSARYWSCRMWESGTSVSELTKVSVEGQIVKQLDEERLAFGWAYVSTVNGEISLDHSEEFIRPDQIAKAATNFMLSMRTAKAMHTGGKIGEVVHSMPLTNEIAKALGIQSDREGWLVAIKVYDDQVWQDVKSGKLAAFSIGGRALKEFSENAD